MCYRYIHILAALFLIVGMGVQLFVSYRQASQSVRKQMNLELQVAQEKLHTIAFGDKQHDYFLRPWYTGAINSGEKGFWSQPYIDNDLAISQLGFFDITQ